MYRNAYNGIDNYHANSVADIQIPIHNGMVGQDVTPYGDSIAHANPIKTYGTAYQLLKFEELRAPHVNTAASGRMGSVVQDVTTMPEAHMAEEQTNYAEKTKSDTEEDTDSFSSKVSKSINRFRELLEKFSGLNGAIAEYLNGLIDMDRCMKKMNALNEDIFIMTQQNQDTKDKPLFEKTNIETFEKKDHDQTKKPHDNGLVFPVWDDKLDDNIPELINTEINHLIDQTTKHSKRLFVLENKKIQVQMQLKKNKANSKNESLDLNSKLSQLNNVIGQLRLAIINIKNHSEILTDSNQLKDDDSLNIAYRMIANSINIYKNLNTHAEYNINYYEAFLDEIAKLANESLDNDNDSTYNWGKCIAGLVVLGIGVVVFKKFRNIICRNRPCIR